MTGTWWALAYDSMLRPTPEERVSTISTLAPLVMAVCAALSMSPPTAVCTVYWEFLSPALWKDSFRSGASSALKCPAVPSSGRITAMVPLPLAARGLRADIAEKLLLIWLSENCSPDELLLPDELPIPAGPVDELPIPAGPVDELPLQL